MKELITETAGLQRRIDRMMRRCIEKKVSSTGVYRSQHQMLMILGKNPGCSQTELAERLEISTAAVTTSLQKLEKGGYISREMNKNDNRVNRLEITEKGKQVINTSIEMFAEVESHMYKDFSEQELELLRSFYNRISANIHDYMRQEEDK